MILIMLKLFYCFRIMKGLLILLTPEGVRHCFTEMVLTYSESAINIWRCVALHVHLYYRDLYIVG